MVEKQDAQDVGIFRLYRIDHILGFFRIWQIPMSAVHGLLGVFNPALPYTPDEMRNNYDFWINPDLQCKPYIMDYFLADFFGEYTEEAKSLYLESIGGGRYKLKPEVDTQQKVAELFASYEKNDKNNKLETPCAACLMKCFSSRTQKNMANTILESQHNSPTSIGR